jgi:hypothetical protein
MRVEVIATWPHLVGADTDLALASIRADRPDLDPAAVLTMLEGSMMTMDYKVDRVRVLVSAEGKVVVPPSCG